MTATDDRGNACGIAALSPSQVGVRALGIRALTDRDTRRELAITDRLELWCAIGGGVIAAIVWQLAWLGVPGLSALTLGVLGLGLGYLVIPPIAAIVTWRLALPFVRRHRFRRLSAVYLAQSRCASCTYSLAALQPADDGCVVCPECAAAWRADRIGAIEESSVEA